MCVLALLVAGCQNSDDDNRGLEYDTLRVNFKGSMTNGTWETGAEVGIFASCTRNDAQDTPMSENANAGTRRPPRANRRRSPAPRKRTP